MNTSKRERDFTFSRSIVNGALAAYVENDLPMKNPVKCLDLSINREESTKWIDTHGPSIHVIESKIKSNSLVSNDESALESNCESSYALIEKSDFNFIYIECTTEGSSYFDCVFRKVARNGLFAISTCDDPALYGRPPEPALRCYGGLISRTFYAPELAVRLIVAAMARSAARFSKSIEVLLAIAMKSCIIIIVQVKKGAESAIKCLKQVKTLAHCSLCEDRAFLDDNDGYIVAKEEVQKFLSCDCAEQNVGRTVMALGPLWAGPIGSPSFINRLLSHFSHSLYISTFLQELIAELRCDNRATKDLTNFKKSPAEYREPKPAYMEETISNSLTQSGNNPLKRKPDLDPCCLKTKVNRCENTDCILAPPFYYNLHKHKPKGAQKLLKVEKIIELLQQLGFRASRTHFDRAAVKTNGTLKELLSVLSHVT